MQPLVSSFLAVKDHKEFTDMDDNFYVCKVDENEQIIFKTSSFKMKLTKTTKSKNEEELPSEFSFCDGKVKRTKGFTTLTASCNNPFLQKQVPLAVIECTKEDEKKITRFWKEFKEAYKVANKTNAKFQPFGRVTDMALTNFSGYKLYTVKKYSTKSRDGSSITSNLSMEGAVHLVGKYTFNIFHLFHLTS